MNIGLGWLGVGVGLAGCLATFFMAGGSAGPREIPRRTRLTVGLTVLLTLIFWGIAMQRRPPFSEGQLLGLGFLIGGLVGAVAILLSSRFGSTEGRTKSLASHSLAFLALFGVSLTYSIFHGDPQDALIGFSIGAAMAAILGYYTRESEDELPAAHIEAWALFGITLAIGVVLAVKHFEQSPLRMWWPLPILLATTVCISSYVGTELVASRLRDKPGAVHMLSTLIAVALVIGLSALYSWRIVANWQLLQVVAVGIGMAAIGAWLLAALDRSSDAPGRMEIGAVVVLLVMAFVVVAFKLWSGLGIALGLIAAWTLALGSVGVWGYGGMGESESATHPHSDTPTPPYSLSPILSLGLVILLFRLFIELYRFSLRGGDFRVHYTFVGAMLGLAIPFLLASSLMRLKKSDGDTRLLSSVGLIGLVAAVTPILLFFIWDLKVVTGWMFGSVAAVAFFLMMRLASPPSPCPLPPGAGVLCSTPAPGGRGQGEGGALLPCASILLLVAGAQLVAIKFIRPLSEIDLTRSIRIWTLAATLAVLLVGLVIAWVASARRER